MADRGRDHIADVRTVVLAHLPTYPIRSVIPLGAGQDNVAYEVNGELIVRFSQEPDPQRRRALVDREARLLTAVAGMSPLPVPEPAFTAAEHGCLAYAKLPGVPLLELPGYQRMTHAGSIAGALGDLLTAMHAEPVDRWIALVGTADHPLAAWRQEAAQTYLTIVEQVPEAHRRPAEAFLNTPPPQQASATVFSHNDLGIEHVLVDPLTWTVTGIIDWSDAAIVDPAYDLGLLYRDLGPAAFRVALRRYRAHAEDVAALSERAVFYARCTALEDLAYGVETGRAAYVAKSLAAMAWLFPASPNQ